MYCQARPFPHPLPAAPNPSVPAPRPAFTPLGDPEMCSPHHPFPQRIVLLVKEEVWGLIRYPLGAGAETAEKNGSPKKDTGLGGHPEATQGAQRAGPVWVPWLGQDPGTEPGPPWESTHRLQSVPMSP